MEAKKMAEILIALSKKDTLSSREKEAVLFVVGVLGWVSLSESRLKTLKEKRERKNDLV